MIPAQATLPPAMPVTPAPRDPHFEGWAAEGLVWLPERGMGRLRVHEAPYDASYFEKYQGYAATPMGRAITAARVELVERHTTPAEILVDVGIGCGAFLVELQRRGFLGAYGFDVNPAGVEWLEAGGWYVSPYAVQPTALSLWDTLEHIPDPGALLGRLPIGGTVFVSLPIVPGEGPPPLDWKHLRRDEHCWYWTLPGFVGWMAAQGFDLLECSDVETQLGREDILTFAFRRERG